MSEDKSGRVILRHDFDNGDFLELAKNRCEFHGFKVADLLELTYLEFMGVEDGEKSFATTNTEYFPVANEEEAKAAFQIRLAGNAMASSGQGHHLSDFLVAA